MGSPPSSKISEELSSRSKDSGISCKPLFSIPAAKYTTGADFSFRSLVRLKGGQNPTRFLPRSFNRRNQTLQHRPT